MIFPAAVEDVVRRLEASRIPYAIGGSLASSTWGNERTTQDADIAISVTRELVERLLVAFPQPYYISRTEALGCIDLEDEFRTVQLLHMEEIFKIDLFFLHGTAYDKEMLRRVHRVAVPPSAKANFCAPEDIVITKLRGFVLGNRVSDKQWNDIVNVLEVQRGRLEESYLDRWAGHFDVQDLLDQARSQAF